ncbi:hypothetical protein ACS78_18365 [Priestia megaterium]|uniref:polysaccharide pyruvyl transferase family protein n=1 Tax=Priestia megaterium TaxID=1404 RepID=UPI000681CD4E|nr:polysaccharide pyruvyl transferase family protein [Priestia megaterium]KNH20170.1 hypothetical protein ACS78_18365 [Priestia megaterium]
MKLAILTYQNALNVGAVLQAYALQQVLTKMGHQCEIIDYRNSYLEETYKSKKITQIKSPKELIKWLLNVNKEKRKRAKFSEFNQKYQNFSPTVYREDNIHESNERYDAFIVGSDQVWNMNLNGEDKNYFLSFVEDSKNKISYAASFGYKEVPSMHRTKTYEGISKLNSISVRETSGKVITQELTNREAQVVLDPTLLLDKSKWKEINYGKRSNEEYILVYIIAATPSIIEFAKKLGEKYNCQVICIHNSPIPKKGVKNIRDCSPTEFLNYIENAKFIVSSSFHGICFSILFEKDFFFELDAKPQNNNSRIETLIGNLNLWERQIVNGESQTYDSIDYKDVLEKLDNEKVKSYQFLEESIKKMTVQDPKEVLS